MAFMENDPLAAYLDALARDVCYRVDEVLKTAPHETTEVVYFVGANAAELGPFVRKRIAVDAAMGDAYGHLFQAQRAGRRFRHLPRIYDVHTTGNELVVVMEYIQGRALRDEVYERDGSVALAAQWFPLLCDGVMELHEQFSPPLIHRDLKPSNIVVSDAGLTIIDFGIARAFREGAAGDTAHFGTRCYAPPEQFGYGQTDERSDVYALGALLFFCLTGVDPKPGLDMREQCEARGIPTPLSDAVCMSMALDPAKRFASAEALGRATRAAYDLSRPVRPPAPVLVRTPASETVLTPQGLQNPTVLPRPAASAACGLLSRVPESLGRIWNTLICFSLLVFFAGSHFAVFHPTGANQSYPTWLLIIEYFFFVDGLMVLMHFALLDKRRLRRRFALLDSYRGKKLAKLLLKALGVLLLCMIVIVAVANATGVVDTSAT